MSVYFTGTDKVLVVSHGLTIRCFVMRFLHLTVEEFNTLVNPNNGDIIMLQRKEFMHYFPFPANYHIECPLKREYLYYSRGDRWAVRGFNLYPPDA